MTTNLLLTLQPYFLRGATMDFHYFTTDDQVKLAYSVQGTGIPIVFLAGYGVPGELWFSQVQACVKAGFQAIVFDRRSHGNSENPAFGQSMQRHGQDLYQLIQHLGLVKPILVGQSMGASAVFSYLKQYGEENVSSVIDVDQTPKILNDDNWKHGMYNSEKIDFENYLNQKHPSPFYKRVPFNVLFRMLMINRKLSKFDFVSTKPLFLDHIHPDWRQTLEKLTIPILFLAGAHSPMWPASHAEAAAKLCSNGKYYIVEKAGHAVNLEQSKASNQEILRFIRSI